MQTLRFRAPEHMHGGPVRFRLRREIGAQVSPETVVDAVWPGGSVALALGEAEGELAILTAPWAPVVDAETPQLGEADDELAIIGTE